MMYFDIAVAPHRSILSRVNICGTHHVYCSRTHPTHNEQQVLCEGCAILKGLSRNSFLEVRHLTKWCKTAMSLLFDFGVICYSWCSIGWQCWQSSFAEPSNCREAKITYVHSVSSKYCVNLLRSQEPIGHSGLVC